MGEDFSARSLLLLNLPLFFSFVEFNSRLCFDLHPFSFLHGPPNRHPTTPDALESISGPADVTSHPCPSLSLSLFLFLFFIFYFSTFSVPQETLRASNLVLHTLFILFYGIYFSCLLAFRVANFSCRFGRWGRGAGGGDEKTYSHRLSYWRFDVSVR